MSRVAIYHSHSLRPSQTHITCTENGLGGEDSVHLLMKSMVNHLSSDLIVNINCSTQDSRNMWGPRKYQDSESVLKEDAVVSVRDLNAG